MGSPVEKRLCRVEHHFLKFCLGSLAAEYIKIVIRLTYKRKYLTVIRIEGYNCTVPSGKVWST